MKVNGVCLLSCWLLSFYWFTQVACCENSEFLSIFDCTETHCLHSSYSQITKRQDTQTCSRSPYSGCHILRLFSSPMLSPSRSCHLTAPLLPWVAMEMAVAVSSVLHLWTVSLFDYYVLMRALVRSDIIWFCPLLLRPRCSLKVSWHEFCHTLFH